MRRLSFLSLVFALLGSLAALFFCSPLRAADQGVLLRDGDRLSAQMDVGDEDAFDMDLVEGGSFAVDLTAAKRSNLRLHVRLVQPDGADFDLGTFMRRVKTAAPRIRSFRVPAGLSGRWQLRVTGDGGDAGAYTVAARIQPPHDPPTLRFSLPVGSPLDVPFAADSTARTTCSVRGVNGAAPTKICILDPAGNEVPGSSQAFVQRSKTFTARDFPLQQGPGRYSLRVTPALEGDAKVEVRLRVSYLRVPHRHEVLAPEAHVQSVLPSQVRQGDAGLALDLVAGGLMLGSTVQVDGDGVTIRSLEIGPDGAGRVIVDVAPDAPYGARRLVVFPPPLLGESVALDDALTVRAPDPTVAAVNVAVVKQLETTTITIDGTGFRVGGALSVSGAGLALGATTVVSDTQATVQVSAAVDAVIGPRDITFTQPSEGGGASATQPDAFSVRYPTPSLGAVSPGIVKQAQTGVVLTLNGDNFRNLGDVTVSGDGVTTSAPTWISNTAFQVTLNFADDASYGARDIVYAQPADGGGEQVTAASAVVIRAPDPTLTSVSPSILRQEQTGVLYTLSGTNFRDGGTVSISGSGVTPTSQVRVSNTQFEIILDVASDAAYGARDVTYTQPAAGGGSQVVLAGALTVHAPDPTIASESPSVVKQLDVLTLTVTGTGFRSGGALTVSGTGLTLGGTTIVSDTKANLQITAAAGAAVGPRDVTFTQSAAGGGASVTSVGAFAVNYPTPTLAAVSPSTFKQEQTGVVVTLTGANFRSGGTVAVSGTGVTASSPTWISDTSFRVTVDVASDATFGARTVTYAQPANGGGAPSALASAFTIRAPDPTISTTSPAIVKQLDVATLTVDGAGFRNGGALTVSGTGLTLGGTTIVSATQATVQVTTAADAAIGPRDVIFTQPAAGGGASATRVAAFTVNHPTPTLSSVSPNVLKQEQTGVVVTLTGTNFRSGGTVAVSGTGVTPSAPTWISNTSFQVTMAVASGATYGARDVTYAQPVSGGGEQVVLTSAFAVRAPDPTISTTTPAIVKQLDVLTLTVNGAGFRSGGALSVSGTGLTLGATSVVSATQATVQVTAAAGATLGARDVTFTQPASGGGASITSVGALAVNAPTPTLTAVSPGTLQQTQAGVVVTLTGTNFRSGGTVAVSGTGVTSSAPTWISDTSFQVTLDVAAGAAYGTRDVTYAQPSVGGGASVTIVGALVVDAPTPTLTAVSQGTLKQEQTGVVVILTGTNFRSGGVVTVSGTGVTPSAPMWIADTTFQVTLDIAAGASYGARDVTYAQPASGGGAQVVLASAFTVRAPDPTVSTTTPAIVKQLDVLTLTVDGTGFRSGGALSVSGTGLTLGATTIVSPTRATAQVTAAANATIGPRDVTFTQPAAGGGASGTRAAAFMVNYPTPTLTATSSNVLKQEQNGIVVTLTGTNFRSGGTVTVSGTGVSAAAPTWISNTSFQVTMDVAPGAAYGPRDVTYAQPVLGGAAQATLTSAITIRAPDPTLSAALPSIVKQNSLTTLALTGAGFRNGGVVTVSGTGFQVLNARFVSNTNYLVDVDVAPDAVFGARSVTYAQLLAAGGASTTLNSAITVLAPDPTISSISPSVLRQEQTGLTVTVTGTGLRAGGAVTFSGTGITVSNPTCLSDSQFQVTVDVAAGATYGSRDVTYTQPAAGGGASVTSTAACQVNAPIPTITSISPTALKQLDSGRTVNVNGTGFRTGGTISVAGVGLTVVSPTIASSTLATMVVSVAVNAPVGPTQVTYTQPASGGGASTTASLNINYADPVLTAVSTSIVKQEQTGLVVTLTGDNFRTGGAVSFSGTGITVSNATRISDTSFSATLDIAANAAFGARDLTYTQPANGGGASVTLTNAVTVRAPDPVVSSVSPTPIFQGAGPTTLTVTGTGLRTGGTLAISGNGLTLGSTTFVSATQATIPVTVSTSATTGTRDITWTQPASGGGASGTGLAILRVNAPAPTVTAVAPSSLTQGATNAVVTLTGTNFRSGGTVSISASGVTVSAPTWVSNTSFQATLTVASNAALGPCNITYTHSAADGGASATLTNGLQVNAPAPTVTSVSPTSMKQGASAATLTVTGTNFRSGGTVTISGTGLTVSSTTFVSATSATVTVAVASNATIGARDITFTQPAAGGGASGTGTGLLTILYPDPTLTAVAPSIVGQGETGTLTLTGTNFRSGGTVSTPASGVTLSSPTWVSDTQFTAAYSVSSGATIGTYNVTYTQPSAGGAAAATKTNGLQVTVPGPTFTSITPSVASPAAVHLVLRIVGSHFNSGTTTSFSGTGITVNSTTYVDAADLDVDVSTASNAAFGQRNVTITPGSGGGPPNTFSNVFVVAPSDPVVSSFSQATLAQGQSSVSVTVLGQNFRSGDTLSASGTGVSFSSVSVTNTSTITASATVSASAATGARDVTVAHAASEGGRSDTLVGAFSVTGAVPTVTSCSPGTVGVTASGGPTRQVPITITGTNFVTGATVSAARTSGSGVTIVSGSPVVVSDTRIDATISLVATASTGTWDLTVTNPGSLGNSGSTGAGKLTVVSSSTLAVNRVIASSGGPYGGERVTIQGSGFANGYLVDFGTVRAIGTQVIDANTIVTTVPAPATVSSAASTQVNVKITPTTGTAVTLANGYSYGVDNVRFVATSVVPAQGATSVSRNLSCAVVVLSAPANAGTGVYGTLTGTNSYWFESGGAFVTGGASAFGPGNRFLVFARPSGSNLPIVSAGLYVLDIPTALTSAGGNAFVPTRLSSSSNHDQQTFTLSATATDTTAPTLSTISPANASTAQDTTSKIVLTFSEPLNPLNVSLTTITLTTGTTTVPSSIALSDDLKTVTITPDNELANSTTYTTTITAGVQDLCGNAFSNATKTFATGSGTDATNPTIDSVAIESLPSSLDGSTGYVNSSGVSGNAFHVYLPRDGWNLDVKFSDAGGAGIDDTSFSAKCNAAVGANSANAELAGNFTVTSTGAAWRIPSTSQVAAADNVTFTFVVKDKSGNTSSSKTVTVNVVDKNSTAVNGGDLDPMDSRKTWVLRADVDAYAATFASTLSPAQEGATTSVSSNGLSDFDEALRLIGLNSGSMTSAAAATTNGVDTGTNAIARRLVLERLRELLNERFAIADDGTHDADSVDVEFLLPGEQGSLSSMPSYSTANSSNSSKGFSEISIGGTLGADSNAYTTSGTIGQAWYDARNLHDEANLNTGGASDTGIYLLGAFKLQVSSDALFMAKISNKFVKVHGGTPLGEDASDDDVLAGSFDRTTSTNTTFNARYDDIMDAVEYVALYASAITAHEIGHSLGLVADGAPKTGMFGNAHYANTFTEATSTTPNTSHHLDYLGNDIMCGATSFDDTTLSGADFKRFSPMDIAHLRNRLVYDEGK